MKSDLMRKGLRLLLLLLAASAPCLAPLSARAQEDAGAEEDERAATVEERRAALGSARDWGRRLRQAGDRAGAARAFNRAGRLLFRLTSSPAAAAAYREALALLAGAQDASAEADALSGLGDIYKRGGECAAAESHFGRAAALSERAGYAAGRARALLALSLCQNDSDHALALRTAEEALALYEAAGSRRGVAEAHAVAGGYQLAQSNLAEASRHLEAALELWRALGSAGEQADALITLGYVEHRRGAWQNVFS